MMTKHSITIFTIGFTGSTAENFFERLRQSGVKKVIDTRLWAESQLSGFAKKKDLPYFLKKLANIDYEYHPDLAPSQDILKAYQNKNMSWEEYEKRYCSLIHQRNIGSILSPHDIDEACFLCACQKESKCHRRVLVEYLQQEWDEPLKIIHL